MSPRTDPPTPDPLTPEAEAALRDLITEKAAAGGTVAAKNAALLLAPLDAARAEVRRLAEVHDLTLRAMDRAALPSAPDQRLREALDAGEPTYEDLREMLDAETALARRYAHAPSRVQMVAALAKARDEDLARLTEDNGVTKADHLVAGTTWAKAMEVAATATEPDKENR